jgi:hypothetical protein
MPNQPNSSIAPRPEARELLATAIECLIALLDLQEPDPELEPNGDEEFDTVDNEPSLGATLATNQAEAWGRQSGTKDDREDEHDGREPDEDGEATLGWPNPAPHIAGGTGQSCLWAQPWDGDDEPVLGWSDMEARYGKYDYLARPRLGRRARRLRAFSGLAERRFTDTPTYQP